MSDPHVDFDPFQPQTIPLEFDAVYAFLCQPNYEQAIQFLGETLSQLENIKAPIPKYPCGPPSPVLRPKAPGPDDQVRRSGVTEMDFVMHELPGLCEKPTDLEIETTVPSDSVHAAAAVEDKREMEKIYADCLYEHLVREVFPSKRKDAVKVVLLAAADKFFEKHERGPPGN